MEDANETRLLLNRLIEKINEISSISDYRSPVKKQYCNLARRLKLLTPMFDEMKESEQKLTDDVIKNLVDFDEALNQTVDLLRFGSRCSKIYLVWICFFTAFYLFSYLILCYF